MFKRRSSVVASGISSRNSPSRLASSVGCQERKAGCVAARTIEAFDEAVFDRVAADAKDNRKSAVAALAARAAGVPPAATSTATGRRTVQRQAPEAGRIDRLPSGTR